MTSARASLLDPPLGVADSARRNSPADTTSHAAAATYVTAVCLAPADAPTALTTRSAS
jgi:hypothetical protein